MTTPPRPPDPSKRKKAPVVRLNPTVTKPLNANCSDVAYKLKRALNTAQAGGTAGALVIAIDQKGGWTVDVAGQLADDDDTMCVIACRILGACLTS
ncbi:MAG: hypothetical protein JWP38_2887 [Herbaspirillum sp.]|jgi:hypothetical protein|nr:hypothetical protein [Herbaspirillum sp.]